MRLPPRIVSTKPAAPPLAPSATEKFASVPRPLQDCVIESLTRPHEGEFDCRHGEV